ncbi:glutathione S-transferase family protein [Phenylobacterium sp.]|jgi:glutathione S-transferase|uniref:glutathione S-transferase family protein n=1 Tax=Phenylobacterium sp. TaxID=1871053 RepID=UPI002F91F1C0
MSLRLTLVSHHLCPYVQRALIVAREADVELETVYIDLAAKPAWFLSLSPTGKTPLLRVQDGERDEVLFESAAIAEYLDELSGGALSPRDPLGRAQQRAWVEYASGALADIAGLYMAPVEREFEMKRRALVARLQRLEGVVKGPFFSGPEFRLADAAFAPVFRYFDVFEAEAGLHLASGLDQVGAWRSSLAGRPSVRDAVAPDYAARLRAFLVLRGSHLSRRIGAFRRELKGAPTPAELVDL